MKAREASKVIKIIKKIYAYELEPEAIKEFYAGEDYLEQLWPQDETKLVGDWIQENFDLKTFLDIDKLREFSINTAKELQATLFFSNLDRVTKENILAQVATFEELERTVDLENPMAALVK